MTGVDSPSESAQVDQLFTEWDKPTSPGCALVIMRDGHIIYERGYGMADLDHNVKITPTTVFHVASMSKQFTAASVLMLAQEGKLSLDDEAIKYVPELPNFGVHHTPPSNDRIAIYFRVWLKGIENRRWELLTNIWNGWRT
jgi:CubicO group peptidase (beta-lactamase class C family)